MKAKLTDRNINRAAPDDGTLEIWDTVTPGLALRIHAGGKRSYCVTTRLHGEQIRRTVGNTLTHTLAQARDAAREVIANAAKGIDTHGKGAKQEAARLAKVALERSTANSFRSVAKDYFEDKGKHGGAKLRSKADEEKRVENHAMPVFADRPIGDIGKAEIGDLLRKMVKDGKPIAANRLLARLRRVFAWAAHVDKIEASPIAHMDMPANENARDRVLDHDELRAIWKGCEKLSKAHGAAVRLMMLTGARRNEASGLLRSEIKGQEWHLPAPRSKNGKPHIWPLSELAREIIASVPQIEDGDPVFTLDGEKPVNGWGKVKERLDGIIAKNGDTVAHWTLHDLRRTLVTGMIENLDIAPHVVEAVVNHVSGQSRAGVAGIYNRSVLLPQRKAALDAWAEHVQAIVTKRKAPGNVRQLRGRKRGAA